MKLQFAPDLPVERLILTLPGETARDLKLFQRYLAEEQHQQKDLKQIATTILEAFLETGDRHFLAWKRGQDAKGNSGLRAGNGKGNASMRSDSTKGATSEI
jgi:hypothetical protein